MSHSIQDSEAEASKAMPPASFIPRGRARGNRIAPKRPIPPPPSSGAAASRAPSSCKGAAPVQEMVSSTSGQPRRKDESFRPLADDLSELNWTLCITIEDNGDDDENVLPSIPTPRDINRRDMWIEKKQARGLAGFYAKDGAGFMVCRRPNDSVLAMASTSGDSEAEEGAEGDDIDDDADADTIVNADEDANEADTNEGDADEDATAIYEYPKDGTVVKFEGKREDSLDFGSVEMEEDEGDMVFVRLDPDNESIGINLKSWEAARISDLIYAFSYEQLRRARDVWGRRFASHVG